MPEPCYRCGTPLEEPVPFCPSCKAPQIKVTRQQEVVAPSSGNDLAPSFFTGAPPPPRPGDIPGPAWASPASRIQWKKFLLIALPFALVNGWASLNPLGWLILVPGSVIWAIFIYRRRFPGPLSAGLGARMGAAIGALSFASFAVIYGLSLAVRPGYLRQEMLQAVEQASAHSPDPNSQQILQFFVQSPAGIFFYALGTLAVVLALLLLFATAAGALTATLSKGRSNG
ncbi:MAG TPA: hypothetical protein VN176_03385 [Verrucomicrobiae bacterium]|nr:hypothetical protein [Verrucomicrobiae bacterium]